MRRGRSSQKVTRQRPLSSCGDEVGPSSGVLSPGGDSALVQRALIGGASAHRPVVIAIAPWEVADGRSHSCVKKEHGTGRSRNERRGKFTIPTWKEASARRRRCRWTSTACGHRLVPAVWTWNHPAERAGCR